MVNVDPSGMSWLSNLLHGLEHDIHRFEHAMAVNWDDGGRAYTELAAELAAAYFVGNEVDTLAKGGLGGAVAGGAAGGAVGGGLQSGSLKGALSGAAIGGILGGIGYGLFAPGPGQNLVAAAGDGSSDAKVDILGRYQMADRVGIGAGTLGGGFWVSYRVSDNFPNVHGFLTMGGPGISTQSFGYGPAVPVHPWNTGLYPGQVYEQGIDSSAMNWDYSISKDQFINIRSNIIMNMNNSPIYQIFGKGGANCQTWSMNMLSSIGIQGPYRP